MRAFWCTSSLGHDVHVESMAEVTYQTLNDSGVPKNTRPGTGGQTKRNRVAVAGDLPVERGWPKRIEKKRRKCRD